MNWEKHDILPRWRRKRKRENFKFCCWSSPPVNIRPRWKYNKPSSWSFFSNSRDWLMFVMTSTIFSRFGVGSFRISCAETFSRLDFIETLYNSLTLLVKGAPNQSLVYRNYLILHKKNIGKKSCIILLLGRLETHLTVICRPPCFSFRNNWLRWHRQSKKTNYKEKRNWNMLSLVMSKWRSSGSSV